MKHDRALSKLRTNKISYLLQNFQRAVYGNCGLLYKLNSSVSLLTMIALRCQNCFKMALLSFKYFYFPSNNFPFLQRFLPPFFFFTFLQIFLLSFSIHSNHFCFPSNVFVFLQVLFFSFKYVFFDFLQIYFAFLQYSFKYFLLLSFKYFFSLFFKYFFFAFLQRYSFSPHEIYFAFLQIILLSFK